MELSDYTGKPCRSRQAYEFIPKRKHSLDLEKSAKLLKSEDVYLEVVSPYLLMLNLDGTSLSLFKSGKIIVKETKDAEKARKIAEKLVSRLIN
ncbi:MAG: hypothetical protein ABID38_01450 [Candidatus Diapherotrites archaeon]